MTDGPFDDVVPATLIYEVDVFLSPTSGEAEDADPVAQGHWLMWAIEGGLCSVEVPGLGFGSVRFFGVGRVDRPLLGERPLRHRQRAYDAATAERHAESLKAIIDSMGYAFMRLLHESPDAAERWQQTADWDERDAIAIANWSVAKDDELLQEVELDEWREALRWDP